MKISILTSVLASGLCLAGVVSGSAWLMRRPAHTKATSPAMVYTSKGYGGYIPAPKVAATAAITKDPVQPALKAYQAGRYTEAERLAEAITHRYLGTKKAEEQRYAVMAQWVDAYSAARRKDFLTARERFSYLRDMAAQLPDHGKWPSMPGEVTPTLEEEGAFQRVVCTSALDGPKAAEEEYTDFLHRYPTSVLIHGAVKRIARMHGGDIPKATEALWKQDMQAQKKAERIEERKASLCGPSCLAELLRRQGQSLSVETLAKEMGTNEQGTSMQAMIDVAARHGLKFQGVTLTMKGLQQQKLPVVTLIQPNHFVLVEEIKPDAIRIWDPNANGVGKGGTQTLTPQIWSMMWRSDALIAL